MTDISRLDPNEVGHAIIEGYVHDNYQSVLSCVSENVEPFIGGLEKYNSTFDWFSRNLIKGFDSIKADRPQSVEIAHRTVSVARFISVVALPYPPRIEFSAAIAQYASYSLPDDKQYMSLIIEAQTALTQCTDFSAILEHVSPSIDPEHDEPGIISLFGGFSLLALGQGEIMRARDDMEAAAGMLEADDGDLWELFDS